MMNHHGDGTVSEYTTRKLSGSGDFTNKECRQRRRPYGNKTAMA